MTTYRTAKPKSNGRELNDQSSLVLLGIVASLPVSGEKGQAWRNPNHDGLGGRDEFPIWEWGRPRQSTCILRIDLPPPEINGDHLSKLGIHVAKADSPLLV